jgi:hypothetical protein
MKKNFSFATGIFAYQKPAGDFCFAPDQLSFTSDSEMISCMFYCS